MRLSPLLAACLLLAGCSTASSAATTSSTSTSETPAAAATAAVEADPVVEEPEPVFVNKAPDVLPELIIQHQIPVTDEADAEPTFHAMVGELPALPSGLRSNIEVVLRDGEGNEAQRLPLVQATDTSFAGQSFGPIGLPGAEDTVGLAWTAADTGMTDFVIDRSGRLSDPVKANDFSLRVEATTRLVTIEQAFDAEEVHPDERDPERAVTDILVGTIAVSTGQEWTNLAVLDSETVRRWPVDRLVFSAEGAGVEGPALWFAFSSTNGLEVKTEVVGPFMTS